MKEPTTNDELAGMIKAGFDSVDTQFRKVHTRLDQMDARLEHIERVILADHARRIERLEDALALPRA